MTADSKMSANRVATILGAVDGLTIVTGLLISLMGQHVAAIPHAAIGAGIAELVGMFAAVYLSQDQRTLKGAAPAAMCGATTAVACIAPAMPFIFLSPAPAAVISVLMVLAIAGIISWLRPERGWSAIAETFGLLLAVSVLCWLASFL